MNSRTEAVLRDVRRTALFRERVPMEAGLGWPVPRRRGTGVVLRLPVFGVARRDGCTLLFAPYGVLTADHPSGIALGYEEVLFVADARRQVEPVGEFPHAAVQGSVGDYARDRARLLGLYDELCTSIRAAVRHGDDPITHVPFAGEREFTALLGRLVEPDLLPYFRALSPRFYERFLGPGPTAAEGGSRSR